MKFCKQCGRMLQIPQENRGNLFCSCLCSQKYAIKTDALKLELIEALHMNDEFTMLSLVKSYVGYILFSEGRCKNANL